MCIKIARSMKLLLIACADNNFENCDDLLDQIHRWQHSELAPRQKLELLLQKVQIPKRTDQYIDGSVKSFNCIILTSLCPLSLFSFLKFSTIDLYDSLVQSCSITSASCQRFPWFFPAVAGKDGPINSLLQIFPPKNNSSFLIFFLFLFNLFEFFYSSL
jgi:hypothetical protein